MLLEQRDLKDAYKSSLAAMQASVGSIFNTDKCYINKIDEESQLEQIYEFMQ